MSIYTRPVTKGGITPMHGTKTEAHDLVTIVAAA